MTNQPSEVTTPEEIIKRIDSEIERVARGSDEDRASRLFILKFVMTTWVLATSLALGSVFLEAALSGNWIGTSQALISLVGGTVSPILTLILGYYFGREAQKGRDR